MNPETHNVIGAAEQAVRQLVQQCRKAGPLYDRDPKAVAKVSRTCKWLLNAIDKLNRELDRDNNRVA